MKEIKDSGKNINLEDFLFVTYELNLLSQIFFNYYKTDYEKLHKIIPDFIDVRCSKGYSTSYVFSAMKIHISKEKMIYWNNYFLNFVLENFKNITSESFNDIFKKENVVV